MAWKEGKLTRAALRAGIAGSCKVRYGDKTAEFDAVAGREYVLDGELKR